MPNWLTAKAKKNMVLLKLLKEVLHNAICDFRQSLHILRLQDRQAGQRLTIGRHCLIKRCNFGSCNRVYDDCHLVDVSLGDHTYISEECRLFDVVLGKFCAIGPRVTAGLGIHPSRTFVAIHPRFYSRTNSASIPPLADRNYFTEHKPVAIGHDVWVGANAIVQDGVTIGDGAIIGSGAVVTKNIPPYAIAAGVPARILRFRFEPQQIAFLQRFCWWDKEDEWLAAHWRDFHDIESFMKIHR